MRVAIGGFVHESNSFSREYTDLELFRVMDLSFSEDIIKKYSGSHRFLGGYIDYAKAKGWDILPLAFGNALPSGEITKEAFQVVYNGLTDGLKGQKVDAVLLHLHGAAAVQGMEDCTGVILRDIREIVGAGTVIVSVMDPHANVTKLMADHTDILLGYNTQPHEDMYEREDEGAKLAEKMVLNKLKPSKVRNHLPLLLPATMTDTAKGPMLKLMNKARTWEENEKVIDVSVFPGFYGTDRPDTGATVIVTTENDAELADKVAKDMGDYFWSLRKEFDVVMVPINKAIETAVNQGGLWAFVDEADDPLGGGPADGTYILQHLIDAGVTSAGISTINDPIAVAKAYEVGLGGIVTGTVGALKDDAHGKPVAINAKVVRLFDDLIPFAFWDEDFKISVGRIAVLDQNGILIVATEYKAPTENINIFKYVGIDVTKLNIIVLKGLEHAYKFVFNDTPKGYLLVESIGVTNPDVKKLGTFKQITRPIYPLDEFDI